jgi:hypothetical protein
MEKFRLVIPGDNICLVVNAQELFNEQGPLGCEVEQGEQGLVLRGDQRSLMGVIGKIRMRLVAGCSDARREHKKDDYRYLVQGLVSLRQIEIQQEQ